MCVAGLAGLNWVDQSRPEQDSSGPEGRKLMDGWIRTIRVAGFFPYACVWGGMDNGWQNRVS